MTWHPPIVIEASEPFQNEVASKRRAALCLGGAALVMLVAGLAF